MLTPVWSGRFKRDVRRVEKRGKDMDKLEAVLSLLIEQNLLAASYYDHPLKGDWRGFRDLHIEPDWLLLYRVETASRAPNCNSPGLARISTFSMNDRRC